MKKFNLYLDDIRTPRNVENWIVVRNYNEFVAKVNEIGIENFDLISLDHDLGIEAMREYFRADEFNDGIKYENIKNEKTGYDVAKFLIDLSLDNEIELPEIVVHSANPVGSENIMSLINNYLKSQGKKETCVRVNFPFTIPYDTF